MTTYLYLKKYPKDKIRTKTIFFSSIALGLGTFLLALVVWPILSFEILVAPKLTAGIISPIPEGNILGVQEDLSQASKWFPTAYQRIIPSKITSYTISIPKLGIEDATVIIGSENLSKSLIQWGGTALPGEFGNAVIFGHSVLPVFFDPKKYMTIFSTLEKLKETDEIFVYFDGITYRYQIFEMKVINPSDLSALEQRYDDSYFTLVTCVPPGTYWKRLVVKAKLVAI